MHPSHHDRKHIRARLLERLPLAPGNGPDAARDAALSLFYETGLEFESLRDLKTLCVLVPEVCLDTPASLYMRGPKGALRLRRTSLTRGPAPASFPEPACPDPASVIPMPGGCAVPICDPGPESRLLGMLHLHKDLGPAEQSFYLRYARGAARLMAVKQVAISNRQRLTFINNLVRDIGHNVIVPNMHFKLLFLQMEEQIQRLARKVEQLAPARSDAPDRAIRRELPALLKDLEAKQKSISRRFQTASLFLESLLRRSHFEKGSYDLILRPCKFKSQVFEPQLERFRSLLNSRGIVIRVAPDVRIDEDITLEADLGLISQVFANLLANAVKYTQAMPGQAGQAEKLVQYGWVSRPRAFGPGQPGVELFVSTTGHEIPAGDRARLFDADFRCSDAQTVDGSGHGLYFVKQIVELHRGRVGYDYAAPMNVFHVTLPCPDHALSREPASCPSPS